MKQKGFIALISAIIISAILLVTASTLSMTGLFSRFNTLDDELKERSNGLALGCADQAMLEIARDSSFSGNETIKIGNDSCSIGPVTQSGTQRSFQTRGIFNSSYTSLSIVLETNPFSVVSWEEVPTSGF